MDDNTTGLKIDCLAIHALDYTNFMFSVFFLSAEGSHLIAYYRIYWLFSTKAWHLIETNTQDYQPHATLGRPGVKIGVRLIQGFLEIHRMASLTGLKSGCVLYTRCILYKGIYSMCCSFRLHKKCIDITRGVDFIRICYCVLFWTTLYLYDLEFWPFFCWPIYLKLISS